MSTTTGNSDVTRFRRKRLSTSAPSNPSPSRAARIILKGLERDKARILVGPDAWFLAALPRLLGSGYTRVVARGASRLES